MRVLLRAAALLVLLAAPAGAACVAEVEPDDTPEAATLVGSGAFCARGNAGGGDQDLIGWDVAQPGLWQLRLETVPGIGGLVELIGTGPDGSPAPVWRAQIDSATGLAEGPPLLLTAGRWVIATTTSAEAMRWRIYGDPVETPAPGASTATDSFATQLTGTGDTIGFDWTVTPAAAAGRLWDIGLKVPPGQNVTLQANAADGTSVFWANSPAGGVAAADRSLAPGRYRFELRGLAPGVPVILAATAQPAEGLVAEPDLDMTQAHEIAPGDSLSGRLIAGADFRDSDVFALTILDAAEQVVIAVDSASPLPFDAWLLDEGGIGLIDPVTATGALRLGPYALPPGRYGIRLSGDQAGARYVIGVEPAAPLPPATEAEPNDIIAYASPVKAGDTLSGALQGYERDHVALEVPAGDLRWWTITATGPGSLEMQLIEPLTNTTTGTRSLGAGTGAALLRLPLAPGRHVLRLTGDGPWTVTSAEAEPPGPDEEAEPNDDALRATPLVAGQSMRFRLDHGGDVDQFTLTPAAPQRLQMTVTAPAEAMPSGSVSLDTLPLHQTLDFRPDPVDPARMIASWDGTVAAERVDLVLTGGAASAGEATLTATLLPPFDRPAAVGETVPAAVTVAAGDPRAQGFEGTAAFGGQRGRLTGWISDGEWQLSGLPPRLEDGEARFRIDAPPWLAPGGGARWAVALQDDSGAVVGLVEGEATAVEGAPAVGPAPPAPLPAALIGTLDAAWDALGATPPELAPTLTDGQIDGTGAPLPLGEAVEIDLAGDAPLPVTGLILTPPSSGEVGPRLRRARIEAGSQLLWEGEVSPLPRPQPVVLAAPVPAASLRLTAIDTWDGGSGPAQLSKLSVLVPPTALPDAFDLARRELGGHIITAAPANAPLSGEGTVWPGTPVTFTADAGGQPFWIMGFHDGRAARIGRIALSLDAAAPDDARIARLGVEASTDGPLGPWQPLGEMRLDAGDAELIPGEPVWARALRFTVEGGAGVQMPASVAVIEAREGGASILGQWGRMNPVALYEAQKAPASAAAGIAGGPTAEAAVSLPQGDTGSGALTLEARRSFYTLDIPADARRLVLAAETDGARITLTDPAGATVPLTPDFDGLAALLPPGGGVYLLEVSRPDDAIVIAWDTSLSVSALTPAILAAVQDMARALAPGVQAMNFVPFRPENAGDAGQPLLRDFATRPGEAWAALQAYPGADSDSDAESALIVAARALARQDGRRAVVLLTDASFSTGRAGELWQALAEARPRVFALRMPTGTHDAAARSQAALMQDWAGVNGGEHRLLASSADATRAFRDLTALLARPVPYRISWQPQVRLPEPARLAVIAAPKVDEGGGEASGARAIEVIVDASGSMLQRVDGTRKIELAREVLGGLVADTIPPGTPFALRVFGTGARGACESAAALPLGPLDRAAAGAAIAGLQARDGARTAIAASLAEVPGDLGTGAANGALVVLLTDGEETCGGDPGAAIAALRAAGMDVRLNIVGFDLQDAALRAQFAQWAASGGGAFFDAADAATLRAALTTAIGRMFTVRDAEGEVRAEGEVGGASVALPPGTYSVAVDGQAGTDPVTLAPGEAATVTVP